MIISNRNTKNIFQPVFELYQKTLHLQTIISVINKHLN